MKQGQKHNATVAHFRWMGIVVAAWLTVSVHAQETIFTMRRSDAEKADAFYAAADYRQAVNLYETMMDHSGTDRYTLLVARCYYYLHQPKDAGRWYEKFLTTGQKLPVKDVFLFAETLSALKQYDRAIQVYTQYQNLSGDDALTAKKIWRLRNKEYLYEDSIHYTIKKLSINSPASDFAPALFGNQLVFVSNRERTTLLHKTAPGSDPFFHLYSAQQYPDTLTTAMVTTYDQPALFGKNLGVRFQQGPVSFYDSLKRMAYVASGSPSGRDRGKRTLQLFFAERRGTEWRTTGSFVYNNPDYSIDAATVSEDGKTLYFSSDMPGGFGRKDLYISSWTNGQWTKPVNLGETVNTSGDESYPALFGTTLYFASDGHPGLGGLDIFYARGETKGFGEPQNIGYPINTNFDDFGLSLNRDGSKGYFSSNRYHDDDIYEATIDLQSYPFTIAGVLKYKEESWREWDELKVLPNAQLSLIDNLKGTVVQTVTSDAQGGFTLTIPYFSQYRIRVLGEHDNEEAFVSLDLSRTRAGGNTYEMVVVKNNFKKTY
ncbi:MAG TPA: tetratricopeptide repeat protein [Chryseolinea sp.]